MLSERTLLQEVREAAGLCGVMETEGDRCSIDE